VSALRPPLLGGGRAALRRGASGLKTEFNKDRRQFCADRIFFLDEHRYIPRSRLSTSLASGVKSVGVESKAPNTPRCSCLWLGARSTRSPEHLSVLVSLVKG
jgi:hypothetical protein